MSEVMKTCLYDSHVALGARIEDFAGYLMPIVYTKITEEHQAVRTNVGMFDVSHMGEITVKGKDALRFVDYVFSGEITTKEIGKVVYGMLLYENGTIVDDLLVYKVSETECFLVVNASNQDKDYSWLLKNQGGFEVAVINRSHDFAEVAVQGPKAEQILDELFDLNLDTMNFFTFKFANILGQEVIISRTGYTGEDGFEIYSDPETIRVLWKVLLQEGVTPCGLGARDTLRFEAALPLYGHEISDSITPLEAGFKFFVDFEKGDFIGKSSLQKNLEEGSKRRLVGIELSEMAIPRQGYKVFVDDEEVGYVTTGYLSISLNKPIALALLRSDKAKIGTKITVEIRKKHYQGFIRDKKFLVKNYKK